MSYRIKLSYLAIPAVLAFAAPSFAQSSGECESDADCEAGSACEKGSYTNGCNPEQGECDSTVYEEEFGSCVVQPVECSGDSDCGEYSACTSSDSGVCWASSDGSSGCEDPDPDAPKYCSPEVVECESDSDCPREFECSPVESCADIACAPDSDCEQPACEVTGGQCLPKEIECDDDSACPSDWNCVGTTQWECTGDEPTDGGAEPAPVDDPGAADPLPPDDTEPAYEPATSCVEVAAVGHCQPEEWGEVYFASDLDGGEPTSGSGAPKGEAGQDDSSDGEGSQASSDSGGCSVAPGGGQGGTWLWALLLGAPLLLRRRRALGESL